MNKACAAPSQTCDHFGDMKQDNAQLHDHLNKSAKIDAQKLATEMDKACAAPCQTRDYVGDMQQDIKQNQKQRISNTLRP